MPKPRQWYRVDVCRDAAGVLQARVRPQGAPVIGDWCVHDVSAPSPKKALAKARKDHQAHEGLFFAAMLKQVGTP